MTFSGGGQESLYCKVKSNVDKAYKKLDKSKVSIVITHNAVLPSEFKHTNEPPYTWRMMRNCLSECAEFLRRDFPYADVKTHGCYHYYGDVPEGTKAVQIGTHYYPCDVRFNTIAILANGDAVSCPCDLRAFLIGNVLHDDVNESWLYDPRMIDLRKSHVDGLPKCVGCPATPGSLKQVLQKTDYF